MKKLCIIYNTAPRYREAVFRAIDEEYDCDWYFGKTTTDIKEMDLSLLKNTHYYKTYGNPNRLYWQGGMMKLLFNRKYDDYLILTQSRSLSVWLFVFLKGIFFPKKRIFGWSHGFYGREGKTRRLLEKYRINNMTCQFVYNERSRNLMIESGIPANKIRTIYNSLDYETQLSLRVRMVSTNIFQNHFGNDNKVIVFIGRLTKIKKLDLIIDAVRFLGSKGEYYNVVFIGDGEESEYLQNKVLNENLSKQIWFYGACYDELKNSELVYNADLCVSPGNVGLTAMHAMVFGTPVITNDDLQHQMPEFEAIIENRTGDFFKDNDVDSLANTISNWFLNHKDREKVRRDCFSVIDTKWNPNNQITIIKSVIK